MKSISVISFLFPAALLVSIPNSAQAQCPSQAISQQGGTLFVEPTGNDDTENIQCALEIARDEGFPTVKLREADYFISQIQIEDFPGTLEGTTRNTSRILIFNSGVDCSAMENSGRIGSGIKFIEGEPRLRFLTILAETPCQEGPGNFRFHMLHFTGQPANSGCDFDVIFGEVDRVDFRGPGRLGARLIAVAANPEGIPLSSCKDRLLGTMKVNRSTFNGVSAGIVTSMKANAQFDVRFNEFSDFSTAVLVVEASQDLAIAQNTFNATDSTQLGTQTISAGTSIGSPNSNRIVVHGNEFFFNNATNQGSASLVVAESKRDINLSFLATQNHFDSSGPEALALAGIDVSGGQVSSNRFTGTGFTAVLVGTDRRRVSGWSVVDNNFSSFRSQNSASADMIFFEDTFNNVFGPSQGAIVTDLGNNFILRTTAVKSSLKADQERRFVIHKDQDKIIKWFGR